MNDPYRDLDGHDAYRLLGVPEDATAQDIRHAFRRQLRLWHPDMAPGAGNGAANDTAARTRRLTRARDILLNDRPAYDRHRAAQRGDRQPYQGHPTPPMPPRSEPPPPEPEPPPDEGPLSGVSTAEKVFIAFLVSVVTLALASNIPELVRSRTRPEPPKAVLEIPEEFAGEWQGRLVVPGTTTYLDGPGAVELRLETGRMVGLVSFGGSCDGFVTITGRGDRDITLTESSKTCQPSVIRLRREGDALRADLSRPGRAEPYATGRLTR